TANVQTDISIAETGRVALVEDTAEIPVIRLHPLDNVVVASRRVPKGARIAGEPAVALDAIPSGHKMATVDIAAGQPILKYGQVIGAATTRIAAGAHVHSHNLAVSDLRRGAEAIAATPRSQAVRTFQGFRREHGKVGVRNYVG